MIKIMVKWSFSGLKQYGNCPRQFNEVKNLKNYEVKVSPQMQYGTEVHKALEDYARDRTPLPKFYAKYKPMIDALLEIPGERFVEHKMALSANKLPCKFDSPEYWVRGIVDFMVISEEDAYIVDYKTGSNKYPDTKQLKLMALMVFEHFPQVNYVDAGLLFVAHNGFITEGYRREDIPSMWGAFAPDLNRLAHSIENNYWPVNPTPLCRWCPVASCEFHKE
jgi:hypothetical protein